MRDPVTSTQSLEPAARIPKYPTAVEGALPEAVLRYRDEGQGPAIILVHGWTLDLEMWDPQIAALSRPCAGALRSPRFGLSSGRPSVEAMRPTSNGCAPSRSRSCGAGGHVAGRTRGLAIRSLTPQQVFALVLDGPPDWPHPTWTRMCRWLTRGRSCRTSRPAGLPARVERPRAHAAAHPRSRDAPPGRGDDRALSLGAISMAHSPPPQRPSAVTAFDRCARSGAERCSMTCRAACGPRSALRTAAVRRARDRAAGWTPDQSGPTRRYSELCQSFLNRHAR